MLMDYAFFKIHVHHFMARDNSPPASVISKCMLWVRAWYQSLSFENSLSLINSLLVAI